MGLTDKAIEILLGFLLLVTLVYFAEQEVMLRHDLHTIQKQLTVERECRVGSTCAQKLSEEAARGAALVAQARTAADAAIAAQKAALEQQAVDASRGLSEAQAQAQAEALTWKQKYQAALKQPDCATWAREAVVCAVR
jgi:uncharacterized protein YfaS (alpha-2-macroglobulin family)